MRRVFHPFAFALALALLSPAAGRSATPDPVLQPNQLIVLSTTDVKGKTSPCGCHVPKGGLARRAAMADSLRQVYGQLLLVDNGGFFPDEDSRKDAAAFLASMMHAIAIDAVNVGETDLRFGRAFLEQRVRAASLPVVSANLLDAKSGRPIFDPFLVKKVGTLNVGIFGLISDHADRGPAKDSLTIGDPRVAARDAVAHLKEKGANVILLLSQLGKTDGEDLVAAVDGIDAAVIGHRVPVMGSGRQIKNTTVCYGGDEGHYICRYDLALDASRHVTSGGARTVELGPTIPDNPGIMSMVKSFEDGLTHRENEAKLKQASQTDETPKAK